MVDSYTIQTPTFLFPAISLLMLAYTNRFLGITTVIRKLHGDLIANQTNKEFYLNQINSMSKRIHLIIRAQQSGIISMMLCVISMLLFLITDEVSFTCFCGALFFLLCSLYFIFKELMISKEALEYILEDCRKK